MALVLVVWDRRKMRRRVDLRSFGEMTTGGGHADSSCAQQTRAPLFVGVLRLCFLFCFSFSSRLGRLSCLVIINS